jgi:hypothetical protein
MTKLIAVVRHFAKGRKIWIHVKMHHVPGNHLHLVCLHPPPPVLPAFMALCCRKHSNKLSLLTQLKSLRLNLQKAVVHQSCPQALSGEHTSNTTASWDENRAVWYKGMS